MKFFRFEALGEGVTGLESTLFTKNWLLKEANTLKSSISAIVPGDVHTSLMQAGIIPDPFLGKNNDKCKWVSDTEWDYENQLDLANWVEKIRKNFEFGGILHTVFDAIDYDASFFIDNAFVTRQRGMFSTIDLACYVNPNQLQHVDSLPIKVHFHVQPWWRTHAVKSQMAFGWDFAPEIRTVGIWKPVRQYYTGPAFFTDVYAQAIPSNETRSKNEPSKSNLRFQTTIRILNPEIMTDQPTAQYLDLDVTCASIHKSYHIKVQSGVSFEIDMGLIDLPLWYPWSMTSSQKESSIIPIAIKLVWNGQTSDEYRGSVVNRSIKWLRNPGTPLKNENWTLEINGEKMFLRGINWVPPDSCYGRIDFKRYQTLLDMAKAANIDILRIWGGGIEEKTEFYDYCDKIGMMVWQEFPFACTNYPRDPRYLRIAQAECAGIVKRTRRHPSVVVYCGGNEFNPIINAHIVSIVKTAVQRYAPDRYCLAVSPNRGDDHNWHFWGSRKMLDAYEQNHNGPFQMLTEFGMQSAPVHETLEKIADINETTAYNSISEELRYHKADVNGLQEYAQKFGGKITDVASLIRISQALQAYALKYAIEVCRSSWPNVSGVFPWQLSDPWPNVSWSIIDHYFHPKLAYQFVKQDYSPILPMIRNWRKSPRGNKWRTGDLLVHNASISDFSGYLSVEVKHSEQSFQKYPALEKNRSYLFPMQARKQCVVKLSVIDVEAYPGTKIELTLMNERKEPTCSNFDYPARDPIPTSYKRFISLIELRFDGWWRTHMTKLMELDRQRREKIDWLRIKAEKTKNFKNDPHNP